MSDSYGTAKPLACPSNQAVFGVTGYEDQLVEALRLSCAEVLPTFCGDGLVEGSEQCEDGNAVAGDGCDAICLNE